MIPWREVDCTKDAVGAIDRGGIAIHCRLPTRIEGITKHQISWILRRGVKDDVVGHISQDVHLLFCGLSVQRCTTFQNDFNTWAGADKKAEPEKAKAKELPAKTKGS